MPKTVSKSKEQIAYEKAKANAVAAREKATKTSNATDVKAADHAESLLPALLTAANRARFLLYGNGRYNTAVTAIRAVGKLSNRKSYEYNAEEAETLMTELRKELKSVEDAFKAALAGGVEKTKAGPKALFS